MAFLVEPAWLAERLDTEGVSIVDASWYLPDIDRNGAAEFREGHIPGAVYFDIDAVVDPNSHLPHTLPDAQTFAQAVGAMGISETDTIVVYDGSGLFSAARVWWMFRLFGADTVFVLNGGLPAWKAAGHPLESGTPSPESATFTAAKPDENPVSFEAMQHIVGTGKRTILDARPAGRFTGEVAEPRAGMRSGHMPGAKSVPVSALVEDGRLKPETELRTVFADAGVDLSAPLVTSCGSGVTAAIISLALETLGAADHRLYDGSWAEWGGRNDTPVETG